MTELDDVVDVTTAIFDRLYPNEKNYFVYQLVDVSTMNINYVIIIRNEYKINFSVSRYEIIKQTIDYNRIFKLVKEESEIIFKNINLLESRLAKTQKLKKIINDKNL